MVKKFKANQILQSTHHSTKIIDFVLIGAYLAAIIAANLLIAAFGATFAIINAFVFIGLDLTTRDYLHERWKHRRLWLKMLLLVGVGSLLSWFLNRDAGPVALASFVAFAGAGLTDTLAYWVLGNKARLVKINGSNVTSAIMDSFIFGLWLGFPWWIIIGQVLAKIMGGFVWSLILNFTMQKEGYQK
jgi:hypothetical protein